MKTRNFLLLLAVLGVVLTITSSSQAAEAKCYAFSNGYFCFNSTNLWSNAGQVNLTFLYNDFNNYTTATTFTRLGNVVTLTTARNGATSLTTSFVDTNDTASVLALNNALLSLGNWSLDKPYYNFYANITALQGSGGLFYSNITKLQAGLLSVGNWSNDKSNYTTLIYFNSVGNWSADKPYYNFYANITALQASGSTAYYANLTALQAAVLSIGNWTLDKPYYNFYSNITALQSNAGAFYNNITLLQTFQNNIYTNVTNIQTVNNGQYTNISSLQAGILSIGNWTADKSLYTTLAYFNTIGNWSNDKGLYTTLIYFNSIGNWTADKPYYNFYNNITGLQLYQTNSYTNITGVQTVNNGQYTNISSLQAYQTGSYTNITNLQTFQSGIYTNETNTQTTNNGQYTNITAAQSALTAVINSALIDIETTSPYLGITGVLNKTLTFSETQLNSTISSLISATTHKYLANISQAITGVTTGAVTNTWFADGLIQNQSETAGGLEIRYNFTGVTSFNGIDAYQQYYEQNTQLHDITMDIWNYNTSTWDNLDTFTKETSFVFTSHVIPNSTNYISSGITQVRFFQASPGNTGHSLWIDYLALTFSSGGVSSGISGSGTTGYVPLWSDPLSLKNSQITQQTGGAININGNLIASNMYNSTTIDSLGNYSYSQAGIYTNITSKADKGGVNQVLVNAANVSAGSFQNGAYTIPGSLEINSTTISGGFGNNGITMSDGNYWGDGNLYILGNLTAVTLNQQSMNGSVYPSLTNTYHLGNSTLTWADAYATTFYENGNSLASQYIKGAYFLSIGNWTNDKSLYTTLAYFNTVGNWSADKSSYTTLAYFNSVGNYTAAASGIYTNITNLQTYQTNSYTNITNLQTFQTNIYTNVTGKARQTDVDSLTANVTTGLNTDSGQYTNITNLQTFQAAIYTNETATQATNNGQYTNITNNLAYFNTVGNWTADKGSYTLSSKLVGALGNWSLDKTSYTTSANLVGALGNWSLDKSSYTTSANLVGALGNWSYDKTAGATIGSLNITNDLKVDGTTFYCNASNNNCGVGTSAPNSTFVVTGGLINITTTDYGVMLPGQWKITSNTTEMREYLPNGTIFRRTYSNGTLCEGSGC